MSDESRPPNAARQDLSARWRAAAELVPALTERLNRLGLGEIEIRHGDLRVRVVAGRSPTAAPASGAGWTSPFRMARLGSPRSRRHRRPASIRPSPAVGHFVYADGLGPGLAVSAGMEIGFVEMLGIRHEVRAPGDGVVRHLVAESGEPVEYGQAWSRSIGLDRADVQRRS